MQKTIEQNLFKGRYCAAALARCFTETFPIFAHLEELYDARALTK